MRAVRDSLWLAVLGAGCAHVETHPEQWADEATPPQQVIEVEAPRVGPVVGIDIGANWSVGPELGSRVGARLRLGRHTALSLFFDYQLVQLEPPFTNSLRPSEVEPAPLLAHLFRGVARVELISASASPHVLIPGLTAGLFVGAGAGVAAGQVDANFIGGLHLAMTRLQPTLIWIPVFFDLGMGWGLSGNPSWRFVFGVGL